MEFISRIDAEGHYRQMSGRMVRTVGLAVLLCMAGALPGSAQGAATDGIVEGLTAHGHSELKVKPDVAYLTVSVTTQARNQADAVGMNATRSTALLDALKAGGIVSADIQTMSYTVEPQYDYNASPPILVGFQVTNSFQVEVHDLTKVGEVLDTASRAGSTQTGDVRFDVADHNKYEGEALVAAVADARSRADLMAGAAGVTVGRLVSLNDSQAPQVSPIYLGMRSTVMAAAPQATTPVQSQQVDITADVVAVYSILPER